MRRLMIVLLAVALVSAACADDDPQVIPESPPETTAVVESAPEPAPEPAVPAEPAEEPAEPEPVDEPVEEEPVEEEPAADVAGLLPVDPALRIGTLDNGLTYYLRNNEEPGTNLSLRLAVNAGSLHEPAVGLGAAHFLEHMMFNGTEEVPRQRDHRRVAQPWRGVRPGPQRLHGLRRHRLRARRGHQPGRRGRHRLRDPVAVGPCGHARRGRRGRRARRGPRRAAAAGRDRRRRHLPDSSTTPTWSTRRTRGATPSAPPRPSSR